MHTGRSSDRGHGRAICHQFRGGECHNHRRRRTVLRDACFSQEALDAFNTGDAYLRAAQNGLARATEQYVKDIQVGKIEGYICQ